MGIQDKSYLEGLEWLKEYIIEPFDKYKFERKLNDILEEVYKEFKLNKVVSLEVCEEILSELREIPRKLIMELLGINKFDKIDKSIDLAIQEVKDWKEIAVSQENKSQPLFNFEIEKVERYLEDFIREGEERIVYLEYLIDEAAVKKDEIEYEIELIITSWEHNKASTEEEFNKKEDLEEEIKSLEYSLEWLNKKIKSIKSEMEEERMNTEDKENEGINDYDLPITEHNLQYVGRYLVEKKFISMNEYEFEKALKNGGDLNFTCPRVNDIWGIFAGLMNSYGTTKKQLVTYQQLSMVIIKLKKPKDNKYNEIRIESKSHINDRGKKADYRIKQIFNYEEIK